VKSDYKEIAERLAEYVSSFTAPNWFGVETLRLSGSRFAAHMVKVDGMSHIKVVCYGNIVTSEQRAYRSLLRKFLNNVGAERSSVFRNASVKIWDESSPGQCAVFAESDSPEELSVRLAAMGF